MIEERFRQLALWRDVQLHRRHGDEDAAARLAKGAGSVTAAVAVAERIRPPTADELEWVGVDGQPLDPDHDWWGYSGRMSYVERLARKRGLWPI